MEKNKKEKNLYDFDYESKEEKKLREKKIKEKKKEQKRMKAEQKKAAATAKKNREKRKKLEDELAHSQPQKKSRREELKEKYDEEIIIGVTRTPEKAKREIEKNNQKSNKTKKNKKRQKKIKTKKQIERNDTVILEKNIRFNQTEKSYDALEQKNKQQKQRKIVKFTALAVLGVATISAGMLSPTFNIKSIEVQGNSKLTKEEIISLSELKNDENIFRVNRLKAKVKIEENAYIEEVKVSKKLPDTITITVKERVPCYMLEYGNGYVYVNSQGYMIELTSIKKNLPILTGISTSKENYKEGNRLNETDLSKLENVIKIMNSAENTGIKNKISRIDIEDDTNFKLYFDEENKVAYLGDCSNIETRMLYLSGILEKEKGKKGEIFVNMNLNTENAFFREDVTQ